MKFSSKYIFVICLLLLSTSISAKNTPPKAVPAPIRSFINKHFKDMEMEKIKYDEKDGEAKVKFRNGYEVEFDSNNNWVKIETDYHPLPKSIIDLLPAGIMKYIAHNYPNRTITEIKRKHDDYKIELADSPTLLFDKSGTFIKNK